MRASDKIDSCNIRAALQILQTNARAPQNRQTAAEVHSLVAVDVDDQEKLRIKKHCAAVKQAAAKFPPPPAKQAKRMARSVVLAQWMEECGYRVLHRIGTFSLGCVTTKSSYCNPTSLFCDSLVRGSFFALLLVLVLLTQSDPLCSFFVCGISHVCDAKRCY